VKLHDLLQTLVAVVAKTSEERIILRDAVHATHLPQDRGLGIHDIDIYKNPPGQGVTERTVHDAQ